MAKRHAIVGFGGMGGWHYENIRDHVKEIEVVGVWDVREEAREKAVSKGLHAYSSFEDLLADDTIDMITIATPNDFHKDYSIAALRAGKNVICEKPVTLHSSELEEVMKVADETGFLFAVHQNRRWDRDYCIVKKILADNTIGKPYYIETRVQGARRHLHGWRGYKLNGGGILLDWGIHLLDQLLMMVDSPVVSVDAHMLHVYNSEVDDNFKTFLRFENGVSALVEISTNCFISQPRWHISCEEGTAKIDNFSCAGEIVRLISDEMDWADEIVYTDAGPTRTMAPRPKHTMETLPLPEVETHWSYYYLNILDVLDGKAELIVKPEQSLRVMRLTDAIFKCAEQGHGMACRI